MASRQTSTHMHPSSFPHTSMVHSSTSHPDLSRNHNQGATLNHQLPSTYSHACSSTFHKMLLVLSSLLCDCQCTRKYICIHTFVSDLHGANPSSLKVSANRSCQRALLAFDPYRAWAITNRCPSRPRSLNSGPP